MNQAQDKDKSTHSMDKYLEKLQRYVSKFRGYDKQTQEGLYFIVIALIIGIPIGFWSNYFVNEWLFLIFIDVIVYAFIYINQIEFTISEKFSIGTNSLFSTGSISYRIGRFFIYYLAVRLYRNAATELVILFFGILTIGFWSYAYFLGYRKESPSSSVVIFYEEHKTGISTILILVFIGLLGIILRLYNVYDMDTWDEGWYSNISAIMHQTQNWLIPIYYRDTVNTYLLFDKPPLAFILGSIEIDLFGYSSLAAKFSMGFFSGLMGIAGYLIYSHQKEKSKEITPSTEFTEEQKGEYSSNKVTGLIFGLSMAVAWFLIFYGRTAYLDPIIVSFTAFTALFAIRAIDYWFSGNYRRSYVYLALTALINMMNLLLKAWQGLIVGPAIAIYLFARYYEFLVPKHSITKFLRLKKHFLSKLEMNLANIFSFISSIAVLVFYVLFSEITYFNIAILDVTIDLFSFIVALAVFLCTRAILLSLIHNSKLNGFFTILRDCELNQRTVLKTENIIIISTGSVISAISGLISLFIVKGGVNFVYERFQKAFLEGGDQYLTILDDKALQSMVAETLLIVLAFFFSCLILFIFLSLIYILIFAVAEVMIALIKKLDLTHSAFSLKIIIEGTFLVPLGLFGFSLLFWAYFLLFKGEILNRDLTSLLWAGIGLSLVAMIFSFLFIEIVKYAWSVKLNKDVNDVYFTKLTSDLSKFILFLTIMSIVIILSFFPFLSWINYMDTQIVGNPLPIRVPGELWNDPRPFCVSKDALINPNIDCKPNSGQLSYEWLFYVYYIGWRYTGAGSYSVIDSFNGVLGPLFLISIPFFITGLYGFLKDKKFATLSFYFSWFLIVLFTFLPASFQLNYYYLALIFPYFGISSFGIAWVFRRTKSGIHFKDLPEKLIIASPIFFLLFYANIYVPYLSNFSFLGNGFVFTQFIASFLLITIGFIAILLIAVRSIPGAFSLGFMIFFLNRYYVTQGYGNFDQDLLLICITLISLSVYLNKDRIPLSSAFFLVLIMITAMTATAWWVNYKNDATSGYEQMAGFIITHDGDYNESTWIFDDNGARFALRFYLHGNITANEHQPRLNEPFLDNKTSSMGRYMQKHPQLRFFIVTNRSLDGKMTPTSDYSNAYLWLKQHYVWVNPLLKIPDSHSIHLFAEKTVLSTEELQFLENYNK